jgi:hypothetical protein
MNRGSYPIANVKHTNLPITRRSEGYVMKRFSRATRLYYLYRTIDQIDQFFMLLQHVTQIVDVVVQNQLSGNLRSGIAAINCVSCGPTCKGFMVPLSAICYVPAAILRSQCQHFLIFLFPRLLVPHVRVYGPIVGNLLFYAVPASLVPTCKRYRSHRCQFVSKVMIKRP